jgi:hypothetical protein
MGLSGHHAGTGCDIGRTSEAAKAQVNTGGPRGDRTHNPRIKKSRKGGRRCCLMPIVLVRGAETVVASCLCLDRLDGLGLTLAACTKSCASTCGSGEDMAERLWLKPWPDSSPAAPPASGPPRSLPARRRQGSRQLGGGMGWLLTGVISQVAVGAPGAKKS